VSSASPIAQSGAATLFVTGREHSVASLGEYYPFSHSQSDLESFTFSLAYCLRHFISFIRVDVRISRFDSE